MTGEAGAGEGEEQKKGFWYKPYQYMALEEFEPDDKVTASDAVEALKEHTTSTGIPHIHRSRGPIKRGCWILITIGAIIGLTVNLYQLSSNFFSYGVNVNIDVTHETQMAFPSVTICNMSPVKLSALTKYLESLGHTAAPSNKRKKRAVADPTATTPTAVTPGGPSCCCSCCFSSSMAGKDEACNCDADEFNYDASSCPAATKAIPTTTTTETTTTSTTTQTTSSQTSASATFTRTVAGNPVTSSISKPLTTSSAPLTTTNPPTTTPFDITNGVDLTELLAGLPLEVKEKMGFSVDDLFLDCSFGGSQCFPRNFSQFFNEVLGNCYMFNAGWADGDDQISKKTGRRHGLQFVLNVNQQDYVTQGDDTAGIRLVVHQKYRMPFPEDEGLALNPGESTSIGLRQLNLARKSQPYGDCVDPAVSNVMLNVYEERHPGVQYSSIACMKTCYQREMIKHCQCGDPGYPMYGQAFNLTKDNPAKICSSKNIEQQNCMQLINQQYSNNTLQCHCPDACLDISYATGLSIGQWPSNVQKNDILTKFQPDVSFDLKTEYKDNLIKVELFFESFDFEAITEEPAYLFTKFLSDCGGVLGLWLGMSLLTIFEFVELGIDLALIGGGNAYGRCKGQGNKVEDLDIKPERRSSIFSSRPLSTASKIGEGLDNAGLDVDAHSTPGIN